MPDALTDNKMVRAKIEVLSKDKSKLPSGKKDLTVHCFFNPQEVQVSASADFNSEPISGAGKGKKQGALDPKIDYKGAGQKTLSIKLMFDSSIKRETDGAKLAVEDDVKTKCIDKLFMLMEPLIKESDTATPRPPRCNFIWGDVTKYLKSGREPFYVTSVDVTYQRFKENGAVTRAEASVKLLRAFSVSSQGQNPTTRSVSRKIWLVEAGQSLDWIAYQEFGDARYWREIAEMNDIANPRRLRPGQILRLPTLSV